MASLDLLEPHDMCLYDQGLDRVEHPTKWPGMYDYNTLS